MTLAPHKNNLNRFLCFNSHHFGPLLTSFKKITFFRPTLLYRMLKRAVEHSLLVARAVIKCCRVRRAACTLKLLFELFP